MCDERGMTHHGVSGTKWLSLYPASNGNQQETRHKDSDICIHILLLSLIYDLWGAFEHL